MNRNDTLSQKPWWNPTSRWFRRSRHDPATLVAREVEARRLLAAIGDGVHPGDLGQFIGALGEGYYRASFEAGYKVKPTRGNLWIGRLLGLHPTRYWRRGTTGVPERLPGADHDGLWLRNGKPWAWTTQPYDLDQRSLRAMLDFCDAHDLEMTVSGGSWHFLGRTVLVVISRREDRDPRGGPDRSPMVPYAGGAGPRVPDAAPSL